MRRSFEQNKNKLLREHRASVTLTEKSTLLQSARTIIHKSNNSMRDLIQSLEKSLIEEKQIRTQLEENLDLLRKRAIHRDQQFRTILETKFNEFNDDQGKAYKPGTAQAIHNNIMQLMEQNSQQVQKYLLDMQEKNDQYMQRRIEEIKDAMKKEIQKHRVLTEKQYETVSREVSRMQTISKEVLDQNSTMRKQIKDYEFTIKILNEEKLLLIQELHQKKEKVSKFRTLFIKEKSQKTHTINSMNESRELFETELIRKQQKGGQSKERPSIQSEFQNMSCELKKTGLESNSRTVQCKLFSPQIRQFDSSQTGKPSFFRQFKDMKLKVKDSIVIQNLRKEVQRERSKQLVFGKLVRMLEKRHSQIDTLIRNMLKEELSKGEPQILSPANKQKLEDAYGKILMSFSQI